MAPGRRHGAVAHLPPAKSSGSFSGCFSGTLSPGPHQGHGHWGVGMVREEPPSGVWPGNFCASLGAWSRRDLHGGCGQRTSVWCVIGEVPPCGVVTEGPPRGHGQGGAFRGAYIWRALRGRGLGGSSHWACQRHLLALPPVCPCAWSPIGERAFGTSAASWHESLPPSPTSCCQGRILPKDLLRPSLDLSVWPCPKPSSQAASPGFIEHSGSQQALCRLWF